MLTRFRARRATRRFLRREVTRAAYALDECDPRYGYVVWFDRVHTDLIKLTDCHRCIVGQVYGNWRNRRAQEFRESYDHVLNPQTTQHARWLRVAWTQEIDLRRRRQRELDAYARRVQRPRRPVRVLRVDDDASRVDGRAEVTAGLR